MYQECGRHRLYAACQVVERWQCDGPCRVPGWAWNHSRKIQEQIENDSDDTKRRLMIEYKGSAIGEMSYYNRGNNIAEIGIKICEPDFQEKGLGRVILSMLISQLFAMGYGRIILDTNLKNTRAQHVYEMLGFQKVRINENSWTNQVGEVQSSVDYELVHENFVDWSA